MQPSSTDEDKGNSISVDSTPNKNFIFDLNHFKDSSGAAATLGGISKTRLRMERKGSSTLGNGRIDYGGNGGDRRGRSRKPICMNSMKLTVLLILCLQNSMFTVLRRYSQGVLKETYSKHELLMAAEFIKMVFSAWMISGLLKPNETLKQRLEYLIHKSGKMFFLAVVYGMMNILSFISLRNIGAGTFTIFAQCKILSTATFSSLILQRRYSMTKWRALVGLMMGVLLFSEHIWNQPEDATTTKDGKNQIVGVIAVLIEVILSGFASIYFEKVIKIDPEQLGIWERNFQLAFASFPIYILFILYEGGGTAGYGGGWSFVSVILSLLGAAGGLLVALSIKYGDSILKTLATTGAIILSSVLDHAVLGGPLSPIMVIAAIQVIIAICNYTFDASSPPPPLSPPVKKPLKEDQSNDESNKLIATNDNNDNSTDEEANLLEISETKSP